MNVQIRARFLVILFFMLLTSFLSFANDGLKIYTEENAPFQFVDKNGKLKGLAVDIVEDIKKRIGETTEIKIMPWTRAYNDIQNEPNIVLFVMARTASREKMFKWVGPLAKKKIVLIGKKGTANEVKTIDDAKKVKAIGTLNLDFRENALKALGFTNLVPVFSNNEQNVSKLKTDRIDLFASDNISWTKLIIESDFDPNEFEIVLTLDNSESSFIAFSKNVSDDIINKWQNAYLEMVKDKTLEKIYNKWFPGVEPPIK